MNSLLTSAPVFKGCLLCNFVDFPSLDVSIVLQSITSWRCLKSQVPLMFISQYTLLFLHVYKTILNLLYTHIILLYTCCHMPISQQNFLFYLQLVTLDGGLLDAGSSSSPTPGTCPAVRFSVAASSSIAPATWDVSSVASLEPLYE